MSVSILLTSDNLLSLTSEIFSYVFLQASKVENRLNKFVQFLILLQIAHIFTTSSGQQ